uniref:NADH dehydrogenase [ubiquinone] flavoprotein 3, mitochondrial n=1 Tax=Parascaris univalens TaxID=6257 RepID=A0A915B9Z4_PARUN
MSLTSRFIRCLMPMQARTAFSAAPQCTTGIEHAEELKKRGKNEKSKPTDYKCSEYLNFGIWSFYDKEKELAPSRLPQPSNKIPAAEPHVTKK